ncbi:hypothetical protein ACROYT_G020754 [Oculina patagonica]
MSLFACTSCNSRHPFEQLSKGDQLCKDCRKTFPLVMCTYCRLEFHLLRNTEKDPVCKKCTHNFKTYGQPSCCEYCNIRAAFDGTKCSRCVSSEKRYGAPVSCDQCKLNCAFQKPMESREKVDGKILCLLCTLSYKRILHKAKKRPANEHEHHKRDRKDRRSKIAKTENGHSPVKDGKPPSAAAAALERSGSARNSPLTIALYSSMANDAASEPIALESHITELTELKEQVVNFKKQLQQKEQALLEKDKKITELKAEHWAKEKELRQKIVQMQKDQAERVENLQTEIRNLKKEVAKKAKESKPLTTSG